jgi:hypothetical protein
MLIDSLLEMSDEQAPTTVTAHASTDVLDLKTAADILANELMLVVTVNEAVTSDGAATVAFAFETSDVENFASYDTLINTGAVAKATLVAGYYAIRAKVGVGLKRYCRVKYTIGTAALTAGKFSAALVPGSDVAHGVQ